MSLYIRKEGKFNVEHRLHVRDGQFSKARLMVVTMEVHETLLYVTVGLAETRCLESYY